MSCERQCGSSCEKNHCGACCGGACHSLTLTPPEYELLQTLAATPFLPVAAGWDIRTPVYLESTDFPADTCTQAILSLERKGMLRIDYDIPLQNFDYSAYRAYPLHGSIALTGAGQDMLEQLEMAL